MQSSAAPHRSRARGVALLVALLLVAGSLAAAYAFTARIDIHPGPNEYNLAAWETRSFPNRWLYAFGQLFRHAPSEARQDADLSRFFELTRAIDALEATLSDAEQRGQPTDPAQAAQLQADRNERDRLENSVEATIEHRLTVAMRQEGLTRSPFFLPVVVWPPVDFEFTEAPRTLATSPRNHIQLQSTTVLRSGLSLPQAEAIEADTERRDGVSALSFELIGLGAYPTIVAYLDSYSDTLSLVAHEWTHNYLFFRPLGFNYFASDDLRTMNETVADLVGGELARDVLARWPPPPGADAPPSTTPAPTVDAGAVLRNLRAQVDALLAQGQIDQAEALMEQTREDLAAGGVYIRKINQAYFAFTNLYAGAAGDPGATSPIGPKIDELRARAGSLGRFIDIVGGLTSVAQLDKALAALD